MTAFAPLLELLAQVPDPRRGQGQMYKLPYVLLFAILAVVMGGNSYRSIVTFIDVHRHKLNEAFGLNWKRAPAHTAVRHILQRLDPVQVEAVFRQHAARLQQAWGAFKQTDQKSHRIFGNHLFCRDFPQFSISQIWPSPEAEFLGVTKC